PDGNAEQVVVAHGVRCLHGNSLLMAPVAVLPSVPGVRSRLLFFRHVAAVSWASTSARGSTTAGAAATAAAARLGGLVRRLGLGLLLRLGLGLGLLGLVLLRLSLLGRGQVRARLLVLLPQLAQLGRRVLDLVPQLLDLARQGVNRCHALSLLHKRARFPRGRSG